MKPSARILTSFALAVAGATLLSGCPIWTESLPEAPEPLPDRCLVDADCGARGACEAGRCVEAPSCDVDDDCGAGAWCDARGRCVPRPSGACRSDADCASEEVCVEGRCTPPEARCHLDAQCGPGRICVDNACRDACRGDDDCGSGTSCQGGICRPVEECTTSADCDGEAHCVGGRCLPACQEDGSCADTRDRCGDDGLCRPPAGPRFACENDDDCVGDHVCRDGVCRTPCASGMDSECRAFDVQLDVCGDDLLCYVSEDEANPECARRADCPDGLSCVGGICR